MNAPAPDIRCAFLWIILVVALMLAFTACSGLRIPQPLRVDASDWPMLGKYETRTGSTPDTIVPPLNLIWDYDITGGIGNGSPLVIDSVLVIGNLRGELYGINTRTGKRIGWVDLGDAIEGSPAISGNIAFVSLSNTERSLVAFDLVEGRAIWRKDYGDLEASPLLHGDRIFIGNTAGFFFCVDRTTGDELWKFKLRENTKHNGIRSSAAASGNTIIVGAEDGALYAFSAETGKEQWRCATGSVIVATPCIANGTVYVGNLGGMLSAVDLESGVVRWQFNCGTSVYASASFAGDRVFIGTTGGTMFALDAATGIPSWSTDLGGVINSGTTISGSSIFVGTLKKILFALRTVDGSIVMKQEVRGRIKTSPAIADGRLFIATDEKLILAFKSSTP